MTSELETTKYIRPREIEEVARKYSAERSSLLVAILGGATGAACGLAIHTALASLALITVPLATLAGAASAALAWRGTSQWALERATERTRIALEKIREELKSLPKETPSELKNDLWSAYQQIMSTYTYLAIKAINKAHPTSSGLSIPPSGQQDT